MPAARPFSLHVREGHRAAATAAGATLVSEPAFFAFEEESSLRASGSARDFEADESAVHVPVRLDARDDLLADVAALVVGDEPALAQPRLVGQDGFRQFRAPAGDAGGDAQRFETLGRLERALRRREEKRGFLLKGKRGSGGPSRRRRCGSRGRGGAPGRGDFFEGEYGRRVCVRLGGKARAVAGPYYPSKKIFSAVLPSASPVR